MNEILYGHNSQEGIVSIESWGNTIHEFIQQEDGTVHECIIDDYQPWYFSHTEKPNLQGANFYNTIHRLDQLKDVKNFYEEGFDRRNLLIVGAKGVNYQIDTGKTLFKGMTLDDIHTLGWDIETTGLDPEVDTVKMISLVDNRNYSNIIYHDTDERWIIQEFIREIHRVNPTVLLTYFGFMFDMPFLLRRCEILGIELRIGKNGSEPYESQIQVRLGVKDTEWVKSFRVFGRHNIDLYYTLVKYDFSNPVKVNSYGLKNVIAEYGLEKEGRTHMGYEELFKAMASGDQEQIDRAKQYCIDDSEDLISLHRHICQADFYLTQICPMNYDKLMYTGNAGRINYLMLRTYLRNMTSVPTWHADQSVHIAGAQVEAELAGVFKHIGDSDIKSMYPNLMLEYDIFPQSDILHVMRDTLADLRDMRYVVKTKATALEKDGQKNSVEYKFIKGQDLAYKALINCFHPDTIILTNKGYKSIENISIGDIVQSINPKTLNVELKPVIAKERKQSGAKMLEFTTKSNKVFKVTEGHNLATFDKLNLKTTLSESILIEKKANKFKVGDAIPIPNKSYDTLLEYNENTYFALLPYMNYSDINLVIRPNYDCRLFKNKYKHFKFISYMKNEHNIHGLKISTDKLSKQDKINILSINDNDVDIYLKPHKGKSTPIKFLLTDFLEFMGWFISEGSTYQSSKKIYKNGNVRGIYSIISIAQYKHINPKNYNEIQNLLKNMGFTTSNQWNQLSFCSKPIYILLNEIWGNKGSRTKNIPKDLLILKNKDLKILLNSFFKGDGNTTRNGNKRYSTSSPKLKQNICFLLQRLGIYFSVFKDKTGCWRIIERTKYLKYNDTVVDYIKSIKEIDIPDYVYDITVSDNHTICVGDNGSVCTFQSYFGVLGSQGFHWKDESKCASVTRHGRNLIIKIKEFIEESGFTVIALDTDGVSYTKGEDFDIDEFNDKIQAMLPGDIEIESSKYKGMVVYKKKTYAVLKDDGSMVYKGAAITSTKMPELTKSFAFTVTRLLLDIAFGKANYEDIKIYYDNFKEEIINISLPISAYTMITRISNTIKQYKENQLTPDKNGKKRGKLPVYELAIETGRDLIMGNKVATYYAFKEVPKPLTPRELKKKKELEGQTSIFDIEVKPKMMKVKTLKWSDTFDADNPDIDVDYYIGSITKKINDLFIHIDSETKVKSYTIMSEKQFNTLFSDIHTNVQQYTYKEFARFIKKISTFSKWKRITTQEEDGIMLTSGEDLYTSIQRYNSLQAYEGEPIYSPIYFDIDSPDLEVSFNDTKCIYNYFTNVLKVSPEFVDIWFSGSKGFHIEINPIIFGIKPMAGLNHILKMIAMDLIDTYKLEGIDFKSIYSYRRQWRLPFSINSKTGLRKTFIPCIDEFKEIDDVIDYVKAHQNIKLEYTAFKNFKSTIVPKENSELVKWFQDYVDRFKSKVTIKVTQKPAWKYKKLKGKFPNCINYLLKNSIIRAGDRNVATLSFLSFFKEFGMNKEQAVGIITEWAQQIEKGLTSTTEYDKIYMNTISIANTVYNSNRYVFKCGYIKSIIGNREFSCPSVCGLKDF